MTVIGKLRKTLKNSLRYAYWSVNGHRIRNPVVPAKPHNIVFLCLGNICRSAYAHHYGNSLLQTYSPPLEIVMASAGLHVKNACSPDNAIEAARMRGIDLSGHSPRGIDEEIVVRADMILAMEPKQIGILQRSYPQYCNKVFLLSLFEERFTPLYGPWQRYHIEDPYGRPVTEFTACFTRIERCVAGLMQRIAKQE